MEKFDDVTDIYREPYNQCPGNKCDGSGMIKSRWESVPCPACEEFWNDMCMDGDPLVEFNKTLDRILAGDFDYLIKELGDKIRAEREEDK